MPGAGHDEVRSAASCMHSERHRSAAASGVRGDSTNSARSEGLRPSPRCGVPCGKYLFPAVCNMPCSNAPKQCFFLTVRLAYRPICMLDGDGDRSGSGAMMLDGDDSFASGVEAGGIGVVGDSTAIFFLLQNRWGVICGHSLL